MSFVITPEAYEAFITSGQEDLSRIDREIARLTEHLDALRSERETVRQEVENFRRSYQRRFPSVPEPEPEPLVLTIERAPWSWTRAPRTIAVEKAITELTEEGGAASPAMIERFLHEQGRTDRRPDIGGSLSHLHRTRKIVRLGRGQWATARPSQEDAAVATIEEQ